MTKNKTFYIIDGHSQIFRAYFAPAAFRNRSQASGATYIFARMLLRLIDKGKPDAMVCAFDSRGGEDYRRAIFADYKAHREPMPEDLAAEMPNFRALVEGMGVPVVEGGKYEADDVIGTLAKQAAAAGYQVRMVSRDKDLKQLLSDTVFLYDVEDGSLFGPEELAVDTGLRPEQIPDLLALMGDSSDGIPGAVGVGPKKAQALLTQYGTLSGVMQHADAIAQPKMRENLLAFRDQAPISLKLATIVTDLDTGLNLEQAKFHGIEKERLLPVLKRLGFNRLLEDLGWAEQATPQASAPSPAPTVAAGKSIAKKGRGKTLPRQTGLFDEAAPTEQPSMSDDGAAVAHASSEAQPRHPSTTQAAAASRGNYTLIASAAALKSFVAQLRKHKRISFDTETTSLNANQAELVGMSFAWTPGQASYIAVRGPAGEKTCSLDAVIKAVGPVLEDPDVAKVGQNLKYDALVLKKYGINLRGVALDTMVAAHLIDSSRQEISLDQLAREHLGYDGIPITALIGTDKKTQITMDRVELARICEYAGEDADLALRMADVLEPELKARGVDKLAYELEMPLVEVLAQMEYEGIAIDVAYLKKLSNEFAARIEEVKLACFEAAGQTFTINSPKQLGEVLFDRLGLVPKGKTAKGARSTSQDILEQLGREHRLPALVLEYRHLSKLKSTYIDALPEEVDKHGRVHTSFHQTVATGRLASTDPNVQNIPVRSDEGRKIRRAFVAGSAATVLVAADYSQIELRLLAHLCEDEVLISAFREGRDIHRAVASEVNGVPESSVDADMRSRVKAIHFGILYGQSAFGLSQALGISRSDASEFIRKYFERFPNVAAFRDKVHQNAIRDGYVTTLLRRRRYLPGIDDKNKARQASVLRQAFNTVTQGSAADLIKTAMLRIHRRIRDEKLPWRLLIQVHDELLLESPKAQAAQAVDFLRQEMEGALLLRVPLKVDVGVGSNWLDAKSA